MSFEPKSHRIMDMGKQSVFERLAKRFSECQVEIKCGKTDFDWDISDEMDTVGNALYAKISSKKIDLGEIPDWFTKEPKGWAIDSTGQDRQFCIWDLYWLSAIKWLAENKPDSGITFPSSIRRIKAGEHLVSIQGVTGLLITLLHLRNENLKRAWLELAKASEYACLYLADMIASTKQNSNLDATPKTDASLIYQANASDFYNIPKSVLSKAAQKQPGEPGYLWSGRDGKRVFYKKADIEKINRSRTKLKL